MILAERAPGGGRDRRSHRDPDPTTPTGAAPRAPASGGAAPASDSERIRVGLVDDHHLVREGLRMVLSSDASVEVVGEAASAAEAFGLMAEAPDVLVVDLTLPDRDGVALIRDLSDRRPAVRMVVLSMHREAETVRQALHAGADGYVVKGARSSELLDAIRAVARGERYLHSSVTAAIVDDSMRWMEANSDLSIREREVLTMVASGRSIPATARTLGISPNTVRRHLANISDKTGVRGSAGLARYAVEHGYLRSEEAS
jgi:DNA-binding NarL/FixJ family response regulator